MPNVLIVAETHAGALRKATFNALAAGQSLAQRVGGELHVAVVGKGVAAAAESLRGFGAKAVHVADHGALEHYLAESYSRVLADLAKALGAGYVGAAATAAGKDLIPRLAAALSGAMASEVLAFGGEGTNVVFRRPMWAGNVIADVELTTPVKLFTIRPTEFPAPQKVGAASELKPVAVNIELGQLKTKFIEFKEVKSTRPELTEARVVVSGGRGTKGDFKEVEALADEIGAAVGASRAAVDAGWVPNDYQVGQTGKVVAPELYIAAGISGAIQHLAGMKGSKTIVAINKDPEAPIFQVADYGLVADLFKALPEIRAAIKASK